MKLTELLCAIVVLAVRYGECFPVKEWDAWKLRYNKHYTSLAEEVECRAVWLQHYKVFTDHMADQDRSFDMEMNELADQELPITRTYLTTGQPRHKDNAGIRNDTTVRFAPSSWDWRPKGAITPVQNQGQMGDGVTFAATESVESAYYIFTGALYTLSTEEMHDCCTTTPTYSKTVFDCVHKIGGLCTRSSYPPAPSGFCKTGTCAAAALVKGGVQSPEGNVGQLMVSVYKQPVTVAIDASHASFQMYITSVYTEPNCNKDKPQRRTATDQLKARQENARIRWLPIKFEDFSYNSNVSVKGGVQSPAGDENQLMVSVYKQPVMVAIDASHASFQLYKAGVYTEPNCNKDKPNHAMQVVGYGTKDGQDYWICKNSWGANWGMQGYILMARNKGNMCGIASNATYPV